MKFISGTYNEKLLTIQSYADSNLSGYSKTFKINVEKITLPLRIESRTSTPNRGIENALAQTIFTIERLWKKI